ncbi:hypothetical protein DERF_007039 [Dermatophagoides farinae]|uniref:Uncharacterized protein n=1 Tax=Dermatophagoides farinae TaxID=6954 RepID=A0A922I1E1_DERFA|nr:hypothetical protein DERF_007039 [Dermatophagoides farinae]
MASVKAQSLFHNSKQFTSSIINESVLQNQKKNPEPERKTSTNKPKRKIALRRMYQQNSMDGYQNLIG